MMETPTNQIVQTSFSQLISILCAESGSFAQALNKAVMEDSGMTSEDIKELDAEKATTLQRSVAAVDHLDVVEAAVSANPRLAARAILPMIYLTSAAFSAQERPERTANILPGPKAEKESKDVPDESVGAE